MGWLQKIAELVTRGSQAVVGPMVGMLPAGQAKRPQFNQQLGVDSFRGWVYAAARMNAQQVAATPLRLYMKERDGRKHYRTRKVMRGRRDYLLGEGAHSPSARTIAKLMDFGDDFSEVTESHPVLDMLRKVNPWLGGFDLLTLTVEYAELTGNWYWYPLVSETGIGVSELWVLPSQWTTVVPDRDAFVRGYLFGKSPANAVQFKPEELLHGKYPNPGDPFYGLGKVEAGWGVVQKSKAMETMDLANFQNMARPDYLMVIKKGGSTKEMDAFGAQVNEKLRGVQKSGSFLTLTGEVELTPLNFPPKDLTGREEVVEEIAAVFGVPVTLLRANDPNLASAQVGYSSWKEMTILPICRMLEDFINQRLLPMFGIEDVACVAFDDPVPKNRTEERSDTTQYVQFAVQSINERRVGMGLTPFDDPLADQPLWNGRPLGYEAPQPTFGQSPFAGGGGRYEQDREEPKRVEGNRDEKEDPRESQKALPAPVAAKPKSELEELIEMVTAHNAAFPGAQVEIGSALKVYERSHAPTPDDVLAEFVSVLKSKTVGETDAMVTQILKELDHGSVAA